MKTWKKIRTKIINTYEEEKLTIDENELVKCIPGKF